VTDALVPWLRDKLHVVAPGAGTLKRPSPNVQADAGAVRTIGRAGAADFCLDVPLVSRVHCRSRWEPDGAVESSISTARNGTWVDMARGIQRAALRPGSILRVGRVEFALEPGGLVSPVLKPRPPSVLRKGFDSRSRPIVVSGPCPPMDNGGVAEGEQDGCGCDCMSVA